MRFLIIDDVEHVQQSLRAIIELEPGWQVAGTATESGPAVRLARRLRPDVVLLDSELPAIDIRRLARQLRELASLGVVLLTTYDDPTMRAKLPTLGVDLCLTKGEGLGLLQALRERYGRVGRHGLPRALMMVGWPPRGATGEPGCA